MHKEVHEYLKQILNIYKETIKYRNKNNKIIEKFKLEEKINRQWRRGEVTGKEMKIGNERIKRKNKMYNTVQSELNRRKIYYA